MKRAEELKSLLKPQVSGADCDTEDTGNCILYAFTHTFINIQNSLLKKKTFSTNTNFDVNMMLKQF